MHCAAVVYSHVTRLTFHILLPFVVDSPALCITLPYPVVPRSSTLVIPLRLIYCLRLLLDVDFIVVVAVVTLALLPLPAAFTAFLVTFVTFYVVVTFGLFPI